MKNFDDFKGVWISQYDMEQVFTSGGTQRGKSEYTKLVRGILDNIVSDGYNTLLVQLRPFGDSICRSDIYPPSYILTGKYGCESDYDAFEILLDEAHKRELSVHGWINPMRLMKASEIGEIGDGYAISEWYREEEFSDRISEVGGRLYLNPAYSDVRDLICDGVREIIGNYGIDGIHIDDYFYPTTDCCFDSISYGEYLASGGELPLADYRRENLNSLVGQIYSTVKGEDGRLVFGISPSGNYDRAYSEQYADVYKWGSESGYADYICPEIYFGFEHEYYPFDDTCLAWQNIVSCPDVKLYIGLTFTKAGISDDVYAGSGRREWAGNDDILCRSLCYTLTLKKCSGVAVFSYGSLYDPSSGVEKAASKAEKEKFDAIFRNIEWSDE